MGAMETSSMRTIVPIVLTRNYLKYLRVRTIGTHSTSFGVGKGGAGRCGMVVLSG